MTHAVTQMLDDPAESFAGVHDRRRAAKHESFRFHGSPECDAMRSLVKTVLMYPRNHRWTLQGFGFLRTYLPYAPNGKRFRLNVWDNALTLPNVSVMHDHPWDFKSWIINGEFRNRRFVEDHFNGEDYEFMRIKCGETGGSLGTVPAPIRLRALPDEEYHTGDIYGQLADEIHVSLFVSGTVTLNDRVGDTEMPRVFWPAGQSWVDAKPREATDMEIAKSTALALEIWKD